MNIMSHLFFRKKNGVIIVVTVIIVLNDDKSHHDVDTNNGCGSRGRYTGAFLICLFFSFECC